MGTLVTKQAPDFTTTAIMPNNTINESFNLYKNIEGKIAVLFFYPLDFTFVCPSEIIAFNNRLPKFKERGVEVMSISVDSHFSHLAWKNTPVNEGGIGNVQFPMVSDLKKDIAKDYDVLFDDSVSLRGTFIIDQDKIVRHQLVNDLPLGRNIDETIRMVDTILFHQAHGEVCPAGWKEGDSGMKDTSEGVASYLGAHVNKL